MNIVFRADASVQIGSGHVMRCLTLAGALREKGAQVTFVCREHEGNLGGLIEGLGFAVARLPAGKGDSWLGTDPETDAIETMEALEQRGRPDWLVVDNYGIDREWESLLRERAGKIMVIDDLADRQHDCDLLLDQNLYADMESRYEGLIPKSCVRLMGPKYALLRPEFARARENIRARDGSIRKIFIFFGGGDPSNVTAKAIEAVSMLNRPEIALDVVIGAANPNRQEIQRLCDAIPNAKLHVQVGNMAELMSGADLAIGAGGSTTWERCALGLPSIVLSLADNQVAIAKSGDEAGLLEYAGGELSSAELSSRVGRLLGQPELLTAMSEKSIRLVDAKGSERVCQALGECQ